MTSCPCVVHQCATLRAEREAAVAKLEQCKNGVTAVRERADTLGAERDAERARAERYRAALEWVREALAIHGEAWPRVTSITRAQCLSSIDAALPTPPAPEGGQS